MLLLYGVHCTKKHISFFKVFWKKGLPRKIILRIIFAVLLGKMEFIFPEKLVFHFGRSMEDHFSEQVHWNMAFSVSSVKMIFLFPLNIILRFGQKIKDDLLPKRIHWKMVFSVLLAKLIWLLKNMILLYIGNESWSF